MTPFTFAIALTPRANARDWGLIEALLDLTLASVRAQTDADWRALIAVHERPRLAVEDARVEFVEVGWPVGPPGPHNDDSGRKKHLLSDIVRDRGGGHLMVLDADDWVDRGLVAAARATIGDEHVGALIHEGLAVDFRTLRSAPLPHPELEGLPFHRFCGSCGVVLIRPGADTEIRRDPFAVLRSHHRWVEVAAEHGEGLARLPVSGAYLVNTGENHSDVHGPYAEWRRGFIARVDAVGREVDAETAARFGLEVERCGRRRDGSGGGEPLVCDRSSPRALPAIVLATRSCVPYIGARRGTTMSAMQTEVFEAFRSIDVPEDKALRAAAALTSALSKADDETAKAFGKRDGDIDAIRKDVTSLKVEVASVKGDVTLLKWMVGLAITLDLTILAKLFSH